MLMVGVAFKLSAVPFHFWAPDVFEGATAEVAAFLSVASKAAALGLLVRLATGFAFPTGLSSRVDGSRSRRGRAWRPCGSTSSPLISVLAAVTCTFGNLAAYGQTNMKRLLAYSTIAHAGYMMMPVAAAVALVGHEPDGGPRRRRRAGGLHRHLPVHEPGRLRHRGLPAQRDPAARRSPTTPAWCARSPGLTVCMAIVMFSLVGLPPLAGFRPSWSSSTP